MNCLKKSQLLLDKVYKSPAQKPLKIKEIYQIRVTLLGLDKLEVYRVLQVSKNYSFDQSPYLNKVAFAVLVYCIY